MKASVRPPHPASHPPPPEAVLWLDGISGSGIAGRFGFGVGPGSGVIGGFGFGGVGETSGDAGGEGGVGVSVGSSGRVVAPAAILRDGIPYIHIFSPFFSAGGSLIPPFKSPMSCPGVAVGYFAANTVTMAAMCGAEMDVPSPIPISLWNFVSVSECNTNTLLPGAWNCKAVEP